MNAVHTVTLNQATIKGLNISWKSQLLEHYECSLVWHKVGQQGSAAPSLNLHVVPFYLQRSHTDRLLCLCVMLQPFARTKASKYSPINSHSMPKDDNMRTLALVTASSLPGHEATSLHNRIWEYSDVLHCRRSQTLHSLTGAVGGHFQFSLEM